MTFPKQKLKGNLCQCMFLFCMSVTFMMMCRPGVVFQMLCTVPRVICTAPFTEAFCLYYFCICAVILW